MQAAPNIGSAAAAVTASAGPRISTAVKTPARARSFTADVHVELFTRSDGEKSIEAAAETEQVSAITRRPGARFATAGCSQSDYRQRRDVRRDDERLNF